MYKIEAGVAVPAKAFGGRSQEAKYPWRDLQVGQSFFVPDAKMSTMSSNAHYRGVKLGVKFTCRKIGDGVRVWRIE
jgi:hypothetical protein